MSTSPGRIFETETMKQLLKLYFRKKKTKVREKVVKLVGEVASFVVVEVTLRAAKQSKAEGSTVICTQHVEKVLPQLILDF